MTELDFAISRAWGLKVSDRVMNSWRGRISAMVHENGGDMDTAFIMRYENRDPSFPVDQGLVFNVSEERGTVYASSYMGGGKGDPILGTPLEALTYYELLCLYRGLSEKISGTSKKILSNDKGGI